MDILKISALAVTAAFCGLILRRQVPELALVLILAAGTLLLGEAAGAFATVRGLADSFSRLAGLTPEIWKPVWKTVGIGIVSKLSAAVCKDAGEGSMAAFVEMAGSALALLAAIPLVETVFDTLSSFL